VRIVLYVEGDTERSLPEFFARWLNPKLQEAIQIRSVVFHGVGNYLKEFSSRAKLDLTVPQVKAIFGLIDFFGSTLPYPDGTTREKYAWAKRELEARVDHPRFRQHFAVHDTEAWLLSDTQIFPREIVPHLPRTQNPESINFQHPPSHRLKTIYHQRMNRKYEKPIEGSSLFRKLDPELACARCPHLKLLLEDILLLAAAT